jgi:hypothetical protein
MPNPCINSGGLLLVPTLFFMEPVRLETLASEIATRTRGVGDEQRAESMLALAIAAARQTWQSHTSARGEAPFTIVNQGGRKSAGCTGVLVLGVLAALIVGGLSLLGSLFAATAGPRVQEYKATSVYVRNQSGTMHEHRNYYVTQTSRVVGKEGIPQVISVGDTVTVAGRAIKVRHIFVRKLLAELRDGSKVVGRAGDMSCVAVESEENLPYSDEYRNRLWIHVAECAPVR